MSRMVVIGPSAVIMPFQALGLELMVASRSAEARKALRLLEAEEAEGVIFITDNLADECQTEIADLRRSPRIAVLSLSDPALGKDAGAAHHERIRELVRRAVGLDMLGERR